jgi:hypothetical protein
MHLDSRFILTLSYFKYLNWKQNYDALYVGESILWFVHFRPIHTGMDSYQDPTSVGVRLASTLSSDKGMYRKLLYNLLLYTIPLAENTTSC